MKIRTLLILLAWMLASFAQAAEKNETVLRLTLDEAEQQFLAQNFQILAGKFEIDAAEGARIQASVYPNPNFQVGQGLYDRQSGKFLDTSSGGNTDFEITQLILLAGKHDKQIKIAEYGKRISEKQFEDLVRTLRAQLRVAFYKLYLKSQTLKYFEDSLIGLKKTLASVETSFEKRSVLLSEVLRIKSLIVALQNDRLDSLSDIADSQSDMKTLLGIIASDVRIEPVSSFEELNEVSIKKQFAEVYNISLEKRPDLKILDDQVKQEETNLSLQKSMSIPDITLGFQYSKQGAYIRDYTALTLGFNIPFFDTNAGNIKTSEAQLQYKKLQKKHVLMDHEHDLLASYQKAKEADEAYRSLDTKFISDYEGLTQKMILNYERKNIGIIAFADFYESYRSSVLQIFSLQIKRLSSFEDLNLKAGQVVTSSKESVKP